MRRNFYLPWHRSTQRQGDKRQRTPRVFASRHRSRLNRVTRTVAEWFAQSTSEWPKTLPQGIQGAANRGPAKAQRSGFGGERRSSGTTELLPRKAKRRMWSLRRRGTPFSPIFRRATKDMATGGRRNSREVGENAKSKISPPKGVGKVARQVKTYSERYRPLRTPVNQRGGGCVVNANDSDKKTPADGSISRRFIS